MAKFRVWNKNSIAWKEKFRGDDIEIPSGKFIIMDESDAVLFRGQAVAIVRDGQNNQTKESSKMIWIEKIDGTESKVVDTALRCQACKYETLLQKELDKHILDQHASIMADDDAKKDLDETIKRRGRPPGARSEARR
mgnify:CR=1 FL=1